MKGIESLIYQVSYSPCGKWIVTIEDKMPIRIWDANKGAELKKLDMKGDATTPIAISPDSKWLAIGGGALTRGEAAIYEMPTGKRLLSLAVEKGATKFQLLKIRALSFNQKGDLLAASSQGTLSVWKIKELAEPAKEVPPKPQIDNKPKAPKKAESPRAETGGPAHNKEVPTRLSAREVFVNRKLQDDIAYVGFRAENSIVVTAAGYFSPYKREISAWDLNDGKERWAVREPAEGRKNIDAKMKYALSPDGMVIVESGKQWLNVINAENGSTISKSSRDIDDINSVLKAPFKSSIPQIVFAPDSRSFARMGSGTLEIRKAPQFSFATAVFRENKFGVKDMPRWSELEHGDLSRDLTRVAAPRPGKQILVWDIAEKKEICKMVDLKDPVQRISYSPCGKWIVSASSALGNRNVFLWDANTGALMKEIEFASRVWDFTFSPDGKWLACGTGQVKAGEVTVWEMPGAKKLVSIEIGGAATALAFNRQGNMLAGGCRGACHIWALKEMKLK
jgi:WD40 repeat protein